MIVDTGQLESVQEAPGGGVVIPALIGRDGVQVYRRPDGTTVRAYRPAAEVFAADYAGAPVTIGHPTGGVSPENWREHAVGLVRDQDPQAERRGSYRFARARLQLTEASAIQRAKSRDLRECSCAYDCERDWTPGVTADGEPYDVVFRGLRPNHVALGPAGFARAGRDARLLITDGEDMSDVLMHDLVADDAMATLPNAPPVAPAAPASPPAEPTRDSLIADRALLTEATARLQAENTNLTRERDEARTQLADAQKELADFKAKGDVAKQIADGVSAELKFRKSVGDVLPDDFVYDGKSRAEVLVEAIKALDPKSELTADSDEAELRGMLTGLCKARPEPHDYSKDHHVEDGETQTTKIDPAAHIRKVAAARFAGE